MKKLLSKSLGNAHLPCPLTEEPSFFNENLTQTRGAVRPIIRELMIAFVVVFGFGTNIFSQEKRYHFSPNDVMEFKLINTINDAEESRVYKTEWKYRFKVLSVEEDQFLIQMKMVSVYLNYLNATLTEHGIDIPSDLRTSHSIVNTASAVINTEMRNPVTFKMDSRGNVKDIQGTEVILAEIRKAAESNPDIKYLWNYKWVKEFYGQQKYRYLIQEFFPLLPGPVNDSLHIYTETCKATRINIWHKTPIVSDGSGLIKLTRSYVFNYDDKTPSSLQANDNVDEMFISWPDSLGYPVKTQYSGYLAEDLFVDVSNGQPGSVVSEIEIKNTSHLNYKNRNVSISGTVQNLGNRQLAAVLPGNGFCQEATNIFLDQNNNFSLEFDMKYNSGIVQLVLKPLDSTCLKVFVKPGDSIILRADLKDLHSVEFQGSNRLVQKTLNELLSVSIPAKPAESIQNIQKNMEYLAQPGLKLDRVFIDFMDMHNRYTKYALQLDEITRDIIFKSKFSRDSLAKFRTFLGNPDGYSSDAYHRFLNLYVEATMQNLRPLDADYFLPAAVILTGWDLYCYRAIVINNYQSEERFKQFSELYPGTEFQEILAKKFSAQKTIVQEGTELPKIKLIDAKGVKHKYPKFGGQYWCIINLGDDNGLNNKNIKEALGFNKNREDPVTFFLWTDNAAVREKLRTDVSNEKVILLAGPERNQAFAKLMVDFPKEIIVVDPNNRIVSFGISHLNSRISWPVEKTSTEKTIKLALLWYSLAAAFTLSLVTIFVIRFRANRQKARMNLKRKIAQLELEAVRSRMNPHFLFNALGSIQNLVNRGKSQEASLYLARFGSLVRTILTQSSKSVIGLDEEIEMIRNYLQLEQLGFSFVFDIQVDPNLDPATIEIPPLLIQPHVENAVIHGISTMGESGKIEVIFRQEGEHLICEVKDNGPGYQSDSKSGNEGLGQGWNLTRQRIQLLKEQYGEEISADVKYRGEESAEPTGISPTTVTFNLPIQRSSL